MAKVLFIYPALNAQEGFNHGIAALSGSLKAIGAEIKLIHLNNSLFKLPTQDELAQAVIDFDPHLICFSVMSQQYKYAVEIARDLKKRLPYPMAIGGVHVTMAPEEVAGDDLFDYICLGECDNALPALVKAIRHEKDTTNIPNIWARTDSGDYIRNPVGDYPDLSNLAPKDYGIFDLDHMIPEMNGWVSIITSRGCPYRCSYCFNHQIAARYKKEANVKASAYLRSYPVDRIMEELKMLINNYPSIKTFIFDDDLFTLDEEYVLKFCEAYIENNINTPFVVNGHVQTLTRSMAAALKAAGCTILKFGVESGSERIRRDVLNRKMSNETIFNAFKIAHDEGLHTSAFLMIGLPTEKMEDIEATIEMMAVIEPGRFRWAVFYPFPGTEIYDLCKRRGLLDKDRMKVLDNFYQESPLRLHPEIELLVSKLQRAFPWYVNARSSFDSAEVYKEKVREIESMSEKEWLKRAEGFLEEDRSLSRKMNDEFKTHYSIRFIQVMAVRSDFKEEGADIEKPAKQWKISSESRLDQD